MLVALALVALGVSSPSPQRGEGAARADETRVPHTLPLGARAPEFTFTDTRWLPRTLGDFGARKAFVIVFTTLDCPVAQRTLPRLAELERTWRARGVQFLAVDVGENDELVEVAARAVEQGLEFPVARDFDGSVVRALAPARTPEIVVLDAERALRYRGRLDARERLSGTAPGEVRADLELALEDVLAGKNVRVAETPVDGCRITPPAERKPAPLAWSDGVADIVAARCTVCHRTGGDAPFALETYADARAKSAMIAEVVEQGRMPPWFASRSDTHWKNERRLSAIERAALVAWAANGAPAGDANTTEAPPLADPAPVWRIGEPDLVLNVATEYEIPASGTVPYRSALLPHIFTEETWVEAVEIRPSNRRVVHHANLAWLALDSPFRTENFITGQVPGGDAMELGAGTALCIPKGALLGLQIHYVPTGKPERDRISVGLRFPRATVQRRLRHVAIADTRFTIPPHAPAFRIAAEHVLDVDAEGIGLFAHMHLRGRDMRFEAVQPDGSARTLLLVPNYDFDWQTAYPWQPGSAQFARGTKLRVVAHFDNSAFNPFNPDPARAVTFGEETTDEMMYGFVFYVAKAEQLGLAIDPATGRVRTSAR